MKKFYCFNIAGHIQASRAVTGNTTFSSTSILTTYFAQLNWISSEAAESTKDTLCETATWRKLQHRLSSYSQKISMFHGLFFYCSLFQNPHWLPVYKPAFTTNAENFIKFVITERGKCTQLHHDHSGKISQIFRSLCQWRHTNFKLIWQEKSINQEINK